MGRAIDPKQKSGRSNRLRRCAAPPTSLLRRNKTATKLFALVISTWLVVLATGPADAYLAYVANENDAKVSVIDLATRTNVGEIPVGIEPEGIAVSPDGKTIVCTSETTSMAHFIDAETRKVTGSVLLGPRPRSAAFKSDGSELWVTSEIGGGLSIIDPVTRRVKQVVKFAVPGLRAEAIQPLGAC